MAKRERVIFPKPVKTVIDQRFQPDVFVLKFSEGTHIRAQKTTFVFDPATLTPSDKQLLQRVKLDPAKVSADINTINQLFQSLPSLQFERVFNRPDDELEKEREEGEQNSNEELADLTLYYYVAIPGATPDVTGPLIDQLNALESVEIAYPNPIPQPAGMDIPPPTPDFSGNQGYLNAAPNGIDAKYAWTFDGGKGDGVQIIDVETAWVRDHEDLPTLFLDHGSAFNIGDRQHGTAVLGILAAQENGYGITGIASHARIGVDTAVRIAVMPIPATIDDAASLLNAGDIIIIELHAPGPSSGMPCPASEGNCGQWEYVAQENWQADFDAIHRATARGIIVVEPAGNGGMNLDSAIYQGRFNRSMRDSGAILVGAGISNGVRLPEPWTNSGSRVDLQGWGDSVMTLGYGAGATFRINGDDERQWYTPSFRGTSSATPIVAGAAAVIQGVRKALGLPVLNSIEMRNLLSTTGTPQVTTPSDTRNIGPLPNLRAALNSMGLLGHMDLFGVGMEGHAWTTWWDAASGWGNWYPIGAGTFTQLTPISVVGRIA